MTEFVNGYIKEDAVLIAHTVNMPLVHPDEAVKYTTLAETTGAASSSGAHLVGVYDGTGRFNGANVQDVLDSDLKTATELGATSGTSGADLIGIRDVGAHFSGASVELALQELGALLTLLSGLTASAAEINALDGIAALVTAANLSTLCAGETVDASALHTHNPLKTETIYGETVGTGRSDLLISTAGISGDTPGGDFEIVTSPAGTAAYGAAKVNGYQIVTQFNSGSFDYTANPLLANIDPADEGALHNAIMIIAGLVQQLQAEAWGTPTEIWRVIWSKSSKQATGAVTPGSAATIGSYTLSSATESNIEKVTLPYPIYAPHQAYKFKLQLRAKVAGGAGGQVKLIHTATSTEVSVTVTSTDAAGAWVETAVLQIAASYGTPQEFKINMKADGTNLLTLYEDYFIEAA